MQFVDAGNGVDDFLDGLGNAGFHLFDAGAVERGGDGDDGQLDVGHQVDAQLHVTDGSHNQGRGNQHYRKDGAFYAEIPDGHYKLPVISLQFTVLDFQQVAQDS